VNGENRALLSSSLDLVATKDSKNTTIQSGSGTVNFDLNKVTSFGFEKPVSELVELLPKLLTENR
jgi:hypothetical protein